MHVGPIWWPALLSPPALFPPVSKSASKWQCTSALKQEGVGPSPAEYVQWEADLQLANIVHLVDGQGVGIGHRVGGVEGVHIGQQKQPVRLHSRRYLWPTILVYVPSVL